MNPPPREELDWALDLIHWAMTCNQSVLDTWKNHLYRHPGCILAWSMGYDRPELVTIFQRLEEYRQKFGKLWSGPKNQPKPNEGNTAIEESSTVHFVKGVLT